MRKQISCRDDYFKTKNFRLHERERLSIHFDKTFASLGRIELRLAIFDHVLWFCKDILCSVRRQLLLELSHVAVFIKDISIPVFFLPKHCTLCLDAILDGWLAQCLQMELLCPSVE